MISSFDRMLIVRRRKRSHAPLSSLDLHRRDRFHQNGSQGSAGRNVAANSPELPRQLTPSHSSSSQTLCHQLTVLLAAHNQTRDGLELCFPLAQSNHSYSPKKKGEVPPATGDSRPIGCVSKQVNAATLPDLIPTSYNRAVAILFMFSIALLVNLVTLACL